MSVPIQQGYCFWADDERIKPYSYLLWISGNAHKFRNDNIGIPLLVTIPILSLVRQNGCACSTRLMVLGGCRTY